MQMHSPPTRCCAWPEGGPQKDHPARLACCARHEAWAVWYRQSGIGKALHIRLCSHKSRCFRQTHHQSRYPHGLRRWCCWRAWMRSLGRTRSWRGRRCAASPQTTPRRRRRAGTTCRRSRCGYMFPSTVELPAISSCSLCHRQAAMRSWSYEQHAFVLVTQLTVKRHGPLGHVGKRAPEAMAGLQLAINMWECMLRRMRRRVTVRKTSGYQRRGRRSAPRGSNQCPCCRCWRGAAKVTTSRTRCAWGPPLRES